MKVVTTERNGEEKKKGKEELEDSLEAKEKKRKER